MALRGEPSDRHPRAGGLREIAAPCTVQDRIDLWSIALNAIMFASFVLGSDRLPSNLLHGGALLGLSIACMLLLVRREMRRKAPLVPLDLLRVHSFRISVIASVCCFTGQMASYVALPFYIQHELGQSTATTGLLLTPWPLAVMLAAPLSARLAQRVPTAWLCAAGAHSSRPVWRCARCGRSTATPPCLSRSSRASLASASDSSRHPTTRTCCFQRPRSAVAQPAARKGQHGSRG